MEPEIVKPPYQKKLRIGDALPPEHAFRQIHGTSNASYKYFENNRKKVESELSKSIEHSLESIKERHSQLMNSNPTTANSGDGDGSGHESKPAGSGWSVTSILRDMDKQKGLQVTFSVPRTSVRTLPSEMEPEIMQSPNQKNLRVSGALPPGDGQRQTSGTSNSKSKSKDFENNGKKMDSELSKTIVESVKDALTQLMNSDPANADSGNESSREAKPSGWSVTSILRDMEKKKRLRQLCNQHGKRNRDEMESNDYIETMEVDYDYDATDFESTPCPRQPKPVRRMVFFNESTLMDYDLDMN